MVEFQGLGREIHILGQTGCKYHQIRFIIAVSNAPAAQVLLFTPTHLKHNVLVKYAKIQIFWVNHVFFVFWGQGMH